MSLIRPSSVMKDLVSEAHPEFATKASPEMQAAVERARSAAGVVDVKPDFERKASAAEREERRKESLRREKPVDKELDKDLNGEIRAKYKIEVTFVKNRKLTGLNAVGISIWESGKRFHGGGDELMFWCKDNRKGHDDGCWSPIPGDNIRAGIALCPNCKRAVNAELLTNMRIGNVYMDSLANELAVIFHQLGENADIFLKFHKEDVRYMAMYREKGPDVAKRLKGMAIYPLKNILKDTAAGADLTKRFKAFVTS